MKATLLSFRINSLVLALMGLSSAFAQGNLVDSRDQAEGWYLPVRGVVSIDGKRAEGFEVIVYKDNAELRKVKSERKGHFELELDIDQFYTVRIIKPGYQDKMLYIDTNLPKDLVKYPDYECFVNLLPPNAASADPFYTDFPSAIIKYDEAQGGFYHSEHYLGHIQTRLAGIATATF